MSDLPVVLIDGVERLMGRVEPGPEALKVRAGIDTYDAYLDSIGQKLILPSDYKEVNRRDLFDAKFVLNQLRYGACVAASGCCDFMKVRALQGMAFQLFSWAWGYDQINNGQDNGACITNMADVLMGGVPLYVEQKVPVFNTRLQPSSRSRFRLARYYKFTHWAQGCDALQRGHTIQYPVQVGSNYGPDGNYVCGVSRGPGNHSVGADGMKFLPSLNEWAWDHMGTWDVTWGDRGRGWHRQAAIENCAAENDAYILVAVELDPEESVL